MDEPAQPQPNFGENDRMQMIVAAYEAAQSGMARHTTDITYTRNWLVTGLTVYYGAIIAAGRYNYMVNVPALIVTLVALAFTVYERGNAQVLKDYCQHVEDTGKEAALLETWMKERPTRTRDKMKHYWKVAWDRPTYWLWILALFTGLALCTICTVR